MKIFKNGVNHLKTHLMVVNDFFLNFVLQHFQLQEELVILIKTEHHRREKNQEHHLLEFK